MESAPSVDWETCSEDGCVGVRSGENGRCLAHLAPDDVRAALEQIASDGAVDARGVEIGGELLQRILDALPRTSGGRPRFEQADFQGAAFDDHAKFYVATFQGDAQFDGATFQAGAGFEGAIFEGAALFNVATFQGDARFDGATFQGDTRFEGAIFEGAAGFSRANFGGDAGFREATFQGYAGFCGAIFKRDAAFGRATFGYNVGFDRATFERDAWFSRTRFHAYTPFTEATFQGDAVFEEATFMAEADFDAVIFNGDALFGRAAFTERAGFGVVAFKKKAWFGGATFAASSDFSVTTFTGDAAFGVATFTGDADFSVATFTGKAYFGGATFGGDTGFDRTTFTGKANFDGATFTDARQFGPSLALSTLCFEEVSFLEAVELRLSANRLVLARARFPAGARIGARWAEIVMDDADFAQPSILAGVPRFEPPFKERKLVRALKREGVRSKRRGRPRVVALRRANVAHLALSNVDLRPCHFAGAHNLDRLRIDARSIFPPAPPGVRTTRRRTIAEEHEWRARRPKRWWRSTGWYPTVSEFPDSLRDAERCEPDDVATIYRELRKGREDSKNEPGAADFYYGEMEMRRLDETRPRAERLILWLYWLVSGYGLRASRALLSLLATILAFAILLYAWGFPSQQSFLDALTFSAQSTTSLFRAPVEPLTTAGEWLNMALRLLGPLFFGLALLSLRGRVKR
jgi:hypothetical protein